MVKFLSFWGIRIPYSEIAHMKSKLVQYLRKQSGDGNIWGGRSQKKTQSKALSASIQSHFLTWTRKRRNTCTVNWDYNSHPVISGADFFLWEKGVCCRKCVDSSKGFSIHHPHVFNAAAAAHGVYWQDVLLLCRLWRSGAWKILRIHGGILLHNAWIIAVDVRAFKICQKKRKFIKN